MMFSGSKSLQESSQQAMRHQRLAYAINAASWKARFFEAQAGNGVSPAWASNELSAVAGRMGDVQAAIPVEISPPPQIDQLGCDLSCLP